MDHRISKDMISNGMTPSGQKSQQDLSRSQYGSAATPSSLAEAYKKISEMKGPALPGEPSRPGKLLRLQVVVHIFLVRNKPLNQKALLV